MTAAIGTDAVEAIRARHAAAANGPYSWRGNADQATSLRLQSTGRTDADGRHHLARDVLTLTRYDLTRADAERFGVGDRDFFHYRPFHYPADREWLRKQLGPREDDAVYFRPQGDDEAEEAYEKAYEAARDQHEIDERERHISEWLKDEYGQPKQETRLSLCQDDGFLVDAAKLAVFEVAREATERSDPRVYRADIVGFRNDTATFLAASHADVADLLTEVDRLRGLLRANGIDEAAR